MNRKSYKGSRNSEYIYMEEVNQWQINVGHETFKTAETNESGGRLIRL